ncbi:MAG: DUF2157 domain-containing protein [Leptospiraceae bacterium]|nr:DUF2157 domain-containing protein [Leptospiraceae bacterium]
MHYRKLEAAVAQWVAKGIISHNQGEKILALYRHEVPVYKTLRFWLLALAVAFLGFALFLVLSANWQKFPWAVQSAIALLPLVVAQLMAVHAEKQGLRLRADLAWFVASLAFGLNIMLQAQIFHISSYYPNGVLFWVLGILPVLWWRPSVPIFFLVAVLFHIYIFLEMAQSQFNLLAFLPLVAIARTMLLRQNLVSILVFCITLYFFDWMLLSSRGAEYPGVVWELAHMLVALALLQNLAGLSQRHFTIFFRILILAFYSILLFLTFKDGVGFLWHKGKVWPAVALATVGALGLWPQKRQLLKQPVVLIFALSLALTIVAGGLLALFSEREYLKTTARIATNAIYFLSLLALLWQAIVQREKLLFWGASVGLLLWVFLRYLDLFENYLTTALVFALCAAALWGLNRLWQERYEK